MPLGDHEMLVLAPRGRLRRSRSPTGGDAPVPGRAPRCRRRGPAPATSPLILPARLVVTFRNDRPASVRRAAASAASTSSPRRDGTHCAGSCASAPGGAARPRAQRDLLVGLRRSSRQLDFAAERSPCRLLRLVLELDRRCSCSVTCSVGMIAAADAAGLDERDRALPSWSTIRNSCWLLAGLAAGQHRRP